MPKRMYMLMFMIEGFDDYPSWSSYRGTRRGGTGQAALNCEGGFGLDTVVKKMIRDGEVTLSRYQSHNNVHGGNPTINRTRITVTQRGREVYLAWKKRMGKRLGLT